jgi:glycosyltransferase involved in cell wall biosynthesis
VRVLIVTNMWPRPDRPGFGTFVVAQAESLEAAGVAVAPFVIAGDRTRHTYFTCIPALRRAVGQFRPDVVHAHFGYSGFPASFQPVPLVVSFCGDDLLGAPGIRGITLRSRAGLALSHAAARRADAIICKSANLVAVLPRVVDRARAHVIPNGVDFDRFSPGDRTASRRRLGIPPDAEVVLFPHDPRQARHKGFALADAAMKRLVRTRPQLRFLHVSGQAHAAMPDWYRAADCLLLTSEAEGSPNVVKEALACGCPVASVDVGDVRRWLAMSRGCVLVDRDEAAVADGVGQVLEAAIRPDPADVRHVLDSRVIARQLIAVYTSVGRGSPSRSS